MKFISCLKSIGYSSQKKQGSIDKVLKRQELCCQGFCYLW